MKYENEKWTVSEVAEALKVSYDSVCGFVNNRGKSAKEGMSLKMILEYVESPKRPNASATARNDQKKVKRLRNIIDAIYGEDEEDQQEEFKDENYI